MTRALTPTTKTAVVLFNLGGPDTLEAVRPFLFNLFNDPAIIGAPSFIRTALAKFISWRRAPIAAEIYNEIGGKSPILEQTEAQRVALEAALLDEGNAKVFICMRYWHPMSDVVVKQVKDYAPDHVILLPLYPQFSTTTTQSSFDDWERAAAEGGLTTPTTKICCYADQQSFINAHGALLRDLYFNVAKKKRPRVLFTAHGLPEKIIRDGDPYQWQVQQTAERIVKLLMFDQMDYVVCYQSRVGPMKWIKPSTDEEIMRAGKEGVGIILVPIAFVSEHSETLVELDIEYKHLAEEHGVPEYHRIPALCVQPYFIEGLKELCAAVEVDETLINTHKKRYCSDDWKKCPCLIAERKAQGKAAA
jgi:protoporphyrin/coproporphyrin ferrochelatase